MLFSTLACFSHTTWDAVYCTVCDVFGFKIVSLLGEYYEDPDYLALSMGVGRVPPLTPSSASVSILQHLAMH